MLTTRPYSSGGFFIAPHSLILDAGKYQSCLYELWYATKRLTEGLHVIHEGLHYFKFGSFWIVESDGPSADRVHDPELSWQLDKLREAQKNKQVPGAPELIQKFECENCDWVGTDQDLDEYELCPKCGDWVRPVDDQS